MFVFTRFIFTVFGSRWRHGSFWNILFTHLYGIMMAVVRFYTSGYCTTGYCTSDYCTSGYCTCVRTTATLTLLLLTLFWMFSSLPLGARIHPVSLLLTKEAFTPVYASRFK